MKIGIDFGSTYSAFSAYYPNKDEVKTIKVDPTGPETIPTVVSISRKGKVSFGASAKKRIGNHSERSFEAFKMLLNEPDPRVLTERGYDDTYTPRTAAKIFLESALRQLLENYRSSSDDHFEEVVICVPEVWCNNARTQDGRSILRDIIQNEIDVPVGSVRVVTEPEAASAFFAYHYEQETKKIFNGHLLLIDFGGGTLDLTLTEVKSQGQGDMEISYRAGGGAGENHDGNVGVAGIAFMQRVIALAMQKIGAVESISEVDYRDEAFLQAVNQLEEELKYSQMDVEDFFRGTADTYSGISRIGEEEDDELTCLKYNGEPMPITYLDLFRAYQQVIEATVREQVGLINRQVKDRIGVDPCSVSAGERDDFKIALVGGFNSFCLVKMQLAEIYNLDANNAADLRIRNINVENKELAISLGAALLAAGRVRQKRVARFSIGLYTASIDGVFRANYAIHYLQDLEPEKTYYILHNPKEPDTPKNRKLFACLHKNLEVFVFNFTDDPALAGRMRLKPLMIKKLEQLPQDGFWNCGFSIDNSEVIRFHALPAAIGRNSGHQQEIMIPLDDYIGMFELSEVGEVQIHEV